MSRPTRGGIGAGGFNTDAGGVVDAGAGASGAAAGAGDSAATGTDSDMGTWVSLGGFIRAVRAGVVHVAFALGRGDVARRRRRNGVSQMP